MDGNFNLKVTIFYDKCRRVRLPPNGYIYDVLIMLSGKAQINYYANRRDTSTFDQFCTNMQLFFEGLKWQRFNLTKWQTLNLTNIIFANPTLSIIKCLCKLCTKLNTIHQSVDPAYHGTIHLCKNIIQACRGYSAVISGLTHPLLDTSGLLNSFYTLIINYKAVQKSNFKENYIQSKTN